VDHGHHRDIEVAGQRRFDRSRVRQAAPRAAEPHMVEMVKLRDLGQALTKGAILHDQDLLAGRTTDEIAISMAAVPEPVTSSISCSGEAPNTGRSFCCNRRTTPE